MDAPMPQPEATDSAGGISPGAAEPMPGGDPGRNVRLLTPMLAFLKTTAGQIATAIVAVLVGWISPAGDLIKEKIWPEKIEVDQEISADEQEPRDLTFILQTKSRAGFSGGTIKVTSPDKAIRFDGETTFVASPADGASKVPAPGALKIRPLTSGKHIVHVDIETQHGNKFSGDIKVVVSGINYDTYIGTSTNWTGKWRFTLNGEEGAMRLAENENRNLTGRASFFGGDEFRVDPRSWHDGRAFLITLIGIKRQFRIQGFPCEVSDGSSKWRVLNGKVESWDNGNKIPRSFKIGKIVERCDQLKEKLSDTPGDGVFEARIVIK